MIKGLQAAFIQAAIDRGLLTTRDVEKAVALKRQRGSSDPVLRILLKAGVLDRKAAQGLQAELKLGRRNPALTKAKAKTKTTERIGPYILGNFLGAGAMGSVYAAEHADLKRKVALKILLAEQPTEKAIKRFAREARLTAKLDHPHIVRVHDAGAADGRHFIAMDLIEGSSLDEEVAGLDCERSAYVTQRIAEALHYAHDQGVIHRDIKPSNVLLDVDGEPRLTDFGLARLTDRDSVRLTKTGAAVGTPAYMAPEQVLGDDEQIGAHTDVYGVGATFYEMLTGKPPFRGQTFLQLANKIVYEEPTPPHEYAPEIPEALEIICLKALEKNLDLRYRDAGELAEDLAHYLKKEPILARRPNSVQRARKWIRRNRSAATASSVVLVGLLIGLAWFLRLPGHLVLETIPSNVTVLLDGRRYTSPVESRNFPPGSYELRFDHPGYHAQIPGLERLRVARNAITRVKLPLLSERGTLEVHSRPSGASLEVFKSGERTVFRRGITTWVDHELPAGAYDLRVSLPGYQAKSLSEIRVNEGRQVTTIVANKLALEPDQGLLSVHSEPTESLIVLTAESSGRARVLLAPFDNESVGSGRYALRARKSGYLPLELDGVTLARGRPTSLSLRLSSLVAARLPLAGGLIAAPVIADFDRDGAQGIAVLTQAASAPKLVSLFGGARTGAARWTAHTEADQLIAPFDANGGLHLDLLLSSAKHVECRDGESGALLWKRSFPGSNSVLRPAEAPRPATLYRIARDGQIRALELRGLSVSSLALMPGSPSSELVLCELDGSAQTARLLVCALTRFGGEHTVAGVDLSGQRHGSWKAPSEVVSITPAVLGDRLRASIVARPETGALTVLDASWRPQGSFGDEASQIEAVLAARTSTPRADDLAVLSAGKLTVLDGAKLEPRWSRAARHARVLPASSGDDLQRLWIDGRAYRGPKGIEAGGANPEPWSGERPPLAIADLEADGSPEVFVASRDGAALLALRSDLGDGALSTPSRGASRVAFSRSGQRVACIETDARHVALFDRRGQPLWRIRAAGEASDLSFVPDIDGDGHEELVMSDSAGLSCLSSIGRGAQLWRSEATCLAVALSLNREALLTQGPAMRLDLGSGQILRQFDEAPGFAPVTPGSKPPVKPIEVELRDGTIGLLVASRDQRSLTLFTLETGATLWRQETPCAQVSLLSADGDERPSLCVASGAKTIAAFDLSEGKKRWWAKASHRSARDTLVGHLALPTDNAGKARVALIDTRGIIELRDAVSGALLIDRALPGAGVGAPPSRLVRYRLGSRQAIAVLNPFGELSLLDTRTLATKWTRAEGKADARRVLFSAPWDEGASALLLVDRHGHLSALRPRLGAARDTQTSPHTELQRLSGLATELTSKASLEKLEKSLAKLVGESPLGAASRLVHARLLLRLDRLEEAREAARASINLAQPSAQTGVPPPLGASEMLAICEARLGNDDRAMSIIESLELASPLSAAALSRTIGLTLLQAKRGPAGHPFLDKACKLLPADPEARRGRALSTATLAKLGERAASLGLDLELALTATPGDVDLRLLACLEALTRGAFDRANALLRELPKTDPEERRQRATEALRACVKHALGGAMKRARVALVRFHSGYGLERRWKALFSAAQLRLGKG